MDDDTLSTQAADFAAIVRGFARLRPLVKNAIQRSVPAPLPAFEMTPGDEKTPPPYPLLFGVAALLYEQDRSLTMSEVSQNLQIPLSTATRVVDRLVQGGMVERQPDPDDRRIVRLALTAAGRELQNRLERLMIAQLTGVLAEFPPGDRAELIRLLGRLLEVVEARVTPQVTYDGRDS